MGHVKLHCISKMSSTVRSEERCWTQLRMSLPAWVLLAQSKKQWKFVSIVSGIQSRHTPGSLLMLLPPILATLSWIGRIFWRRRNKKSVRSPKRPPQLNQTFKSQPILDGSLNYFQHRPRVGKQIWSDPKPDPTSPTLICHDLSWPSHPIKSNFQISAKSWLISMKFSA